jgi:hypothetical protein
LANAETFTVSPGAHASLTHRGQGVARLIAEQGGKGNFLFRGRPVSKIRRSRVACRGSPASRVQTSRRSENRRRVDLGSPAGVSRRTSVPSLGAEYTATHSALAVMVGDGEFFGETA